MFFRRISLFAVVISLLAGCAKDPGAILPSGNKEHKTESGIHTVSFKVMADADTRTSLIEGDDVATFFWSEEDENRFKVYENGVEPSDMAVVFSQDKRTASILAEFASTAATSYTYKAEFGSSPVPSVQNATSGTFDPCADRLEAESTVSGTPESIRELTLNFTRTVAISKMTFLGLKAGDTVTEVVLSAAKPFVGSSKTLTLKCSEKVSGEGKASLFVVTDPVEDILFTVSVKCASSNATKQFKNAITLSTDYLARFSVDLSNGTGGQTSDSGRHIWYELPAITDKNNDGQIDNDPDLYYAYHLCAGGEKGPGGLKARNYTVCFSAKHHCPLWVAAPRHKMYVGSSGRNDAYGQDPDIPSNIQFKSKATDGGCNKGHMLGSAERTSSAATNRQVFYYSNIAPQGTNFNTGGGAWNNLEDFIDELVCVDTLYEVVGCYFDRYEDAYNNKSTPQKISFGGISGVSKPTMFYYALLRTKKGDSGKDVTKCSASELQCVAFVMSHNQSKGHKPQIKDMISISELEKLTGQTYFVNVPNAPKSSFTASDWGL